MKKLFVHIPKTAGVSILSLIRKHLQYTCKLHNDMHTINIQHVQNYRDMFSFCVVRDPYERIVSAYNFLKEPMLKVKEYSKLYEGLLLYKEGLLGLLLYKAIFSKYTSFADCIKDLDTLQHTNMLFVPQHKFVCDEDGNILVNSVIKMEHISDLQQIDPIFAHLPHRNKSIKRDFVLTNDMKQIIYRVYAKDFEIFQYSSQISPPPQS